MPDPTPRRLVIRGWFEEYRCGCISGHVRLKRELPGYCPTHGEDRRHVHREIEYVKR